MRLRRFLANALLALLLGGAAMAVSRSGLGGGEPFESYFAFAARDRDVVEAMVQSARPRRAPLSP